MIKFATYKKARITKMLVAECECCNKKVNTVNLQATSIDGLEADKEIRVCIKCVSGKIV